VNDDRVPIDEKGNVNEQLLRNLPTRSWPFLRDV
jgi:hypothetical protein